MGLGLGLGLRFMYASTHKFCVGAIVVGANVMEPFPEQTRWMAVRTEELRGILHAAVLASLTCTCRHLMVPGPVMLTRDVRGS